MSEDLLKICDLIKRNGRVTRSIVAKMGSILPLLRKLEDIQQEATILRKKLRAGLKDPEAPAKQPDKSTDLFKKVALALGHVMMKKRDLLAKLREQGIQLPSSFGFYLSAWKKDELFKTCFEKGWYCLSPRGKNVAGLPQKESSQEIIAPAVSPTAPEAKPPKEIIKTFRKGSPSQLDLIVLELYKIKPATLKKRDIEALFNNWGRTWTSNSIIVLLTKTGSKGMIASFGKRGDRRFSLTERGEARGKQLSESQPSQKTDAGSPPCEEKQDFYALRKEQLTDAHYDVLEKAYGAGDFNRQRLFWVPRNGNRDLVWWGLCDEFIVPDQPLLGYLLEHRAFPESMFELPCAPCVFKVDGKKIQFDPLKKVPDRIFEFVKRRGILPKELAI